MAPGANPSDPAMVRRVLPHSEFVSLTQKKLAIICKLSGFWSETFLTVKDTLGTSLFLPSTTPASNHPVSTTSICSPFVRSMVGPLQLDPNRAKANRRIRPRGEARIRAILEHSPVHP